MAVNNIEDAFVQYLLAQTGLFALVGNKIEPMKQAQEIPNPGVIYECMEDKPQGITLNGCPPLNRAVYGFMAVAYENDPMNAIYFWFKRHFDRPKRIELHNTDGPYRRVTVTPVNGYAIKQDPFAGADKYPYCKTCFIAIQYAEPESP